MASYDNRLDWVRLGRFSYDPMASSLVRFMLPCTNGGSSSPCSPSPPCEQKTGTDSSHTLPPPLFDLYSHKLLNIRK
jgi:hypothetical protein